MDWQKIEIEYITDPAASYRSLAEKYEIPLSTLEKRARREKWAEQKKGSAVSTVKKAVKAHENRQKKRIEKVIHLGDRLLDRLEEAIEEIDKQVIREVTKTKTLTFGDERDPKRLTKETVKEKERLDVVQTMVDRAGLKAIASSVRDVMEILSLRNKLDEKEQKARIANLERQAKRDELPDGQAYGVVLLPSILPPEAPPHEEEA